jgi:excisionase family DNA binding protein
VRKDDAAEAYRRAEQRLRLILLGDGFSQPGAVKGEELRAQVTTALRAMRTAFAARPGDDRAEQAEARVADLETELLRLAAEAGASARESDALLTAAEAADELGISVTAIYRAVRKDEIQAFRPASRARGALRIPSREVARFRAGRATGRAD